MPSLEKSSLGDRIKSFYIVPSGMRDEMAAIIVFQCIGKNIFHNSMIQQFIIYFSFSLLGHLLSDRRWITEFKTTYSDLSYSMNVFEPSILDSIMFLDRIHRPGARSMHLAYVSYPES